MRSEDKPAAREILTLLLEAQKIRTMRGIFGRLAPGEDGRIRTVLNPCGTESGRLSSSDTFLEPSTNLQNLPKKTAKLDPLYDVRSVIVPSDGMVLCEADYSSAERRLLAYLARERNAIKQIEEGVNSYKWFAAKLYGLDDWRRIAKSDPKYHVGKTSVLQLDRGSGWKTLMEKVNADADLTGATITPRVAKAAFELFHDWFPGYRRFFGEVEAELRRTSVLTNALGRRRQFFARRGAKAHWEALVREGVSFLAQAVGDILNERLAEIYKKYQGKYVWLLLQIHDALLWEWHEGSHLLGCKLVKRTLERPTTIASGPLFIPAAISVSADSWADLKEIEC